MTGKSCRTFYPTMQCMAKVSEMYVRHHGTARKQKWQLLKLKHSQSKKWLKFLTNLHRKSGPPFVLHPILTSLLLMHDVEANPGTTKFPCGSCEMAARSNHEAICCDRCSRWFYIACQGMSKATYNRLPGQEFAWSCNTCTLNVYNSSFFQSTIEVSQTPSSPS